MNYRNALTAGLPALILGIAGCGESGTPQADAPDAIYINGKIITVDENSTVAEAFAVDGDRFLAVGSNADIESLADAGTVIVDLGGAAVTPGLSDNHDHLFNAGKYLYRGVDLIGVDTFDELRQRLESAVEANGPDEVVFTTTGWAVDPLPTRQQLDEISSEAPILLIRSRRGYGIANSAALARLGISKDKPEFMGAAVPVDEDGEPTGNSPGYPYGVYFQDALLPPVTPEYEDEIFAREMQRRNELGITSIRDLAVWPAGVDAYRRYHDEGKMTLRAAVALEYPDQENTIAHLAELPAVDHSDPWFQLDSVAEEPWTPGTLPLDEYTEFVLELNRIGWRPAPHTSSDPQRGTSADDALDQTLTAYEVANRESSISDRRWYVEHVPLATPAHMERMAELGLVVSAQVYGYADQSHLELPVHGDLSAERRAHYNPIRGFLDHGIPVVGGSDYNGPRVGDPDPNNPMRAIYFYVTRRSTSGEVATPAEKVSREEALRIFTVYPAYATFQEAQRGSIAPGMLADFVILDRDLLTVPENQILDTRALATFVGGRKVYAAPDSGF